MIMSAISLPFTIFCLLIFSSCSSTNNSSRALNFQFQKNDWTEIDPDKSKYATYNKKNHSLMIVNSYCKKTTSLMGLRDTILKEIKAIEVLETVNSNRSLSTRARGEIEEAKRYFQINLLRKNDCLYNFMLIATSESVLDQEIKSLNTLMDKTHIYISSEH